MTTKHKVYLGETLHKSLKIEAVIGGVGLSALARKLITKAMILIDVKKLMEEMKKNDI